MGLLQALSRSPSSELCLAAPPWAAEAVLPWPGSSCAAQQANSWPSSCSWLVLPYQAHLPKCCLLITTSTSSKITALLEIVIAREKGVALTEAGEAFQIQDKHKHSFRVQHAADWTQSIHVKKFPGPNAQRKHQSHKSKSALVSLVSHVNKMCQLQGHTYLWRKSCLKFDYKCRCSWNKLNKN